MASLRRTRRFSSSPTPSEPQQLQHSDRDPYYDDTLILDAPVPVLSIASLAQDTPGQRSGDRSRLSVRKTKSKLSVNPASPHNSHGSEEEDGQYRTPSSRRNATRDVSPNEIEYRIGRKRQEKASRSRYLRSRDLGGTVDPLYLRQTSFPDDDNKQLSAPTTPAPRFLVPKSNARSRSQSRSPSPMLLNYHPHEGHYSSSIDSQPDALSHLNSTSRSTGTPRSRSRCSSKASNHRDTHGNSGLSVSSSRAPSPLPPPSLTIGTSKFNVDSSPRTGSSSRPESPAEVPSRATSALSSFALSTHDQSVNKHPRASQSERSHSKTLQASPVTVFSSQLPASAVPRTLKDVTRLLEENRGKTSQRNLPRRPEPVAHDLDERFFQKSSSKSTPMTSSKQTLKKEIGRSTLSQDAKIIAQIDSPRRTRSKHGLALTTEKGHILGEPPAGEASQINRMPSARRGTTHENPDRLNVTPPQHIHATGPSITSKSGSSTRSHRNTESATVHNSSSGSVPGRGQDGVAPPVSAILMRGRNGITGDESQSRPNYIREAQSKERHDWRQRQSIYNHGSGMNRLESISSSAHMYTSPSSLPKPVPKPILTSRQIATTSRIASANISTPHVAHSEQPISHSSDASSSRRTRKLVIRNPSPDDRLSSASSSNLGPRNSNVATTSEDYTILALSGTQTSLGQTNDVDYLVPDDVAEEVANDEERRRKALAGLVNDLHLVSHNQDHKQHTHDRHTTNRPKGPVVLHRESHHNHEDDEEDDDAFFARLNIPDDEDSLLEEPEPEADTFNEYEENHPDEEHSESYPMGTGEDDLVLPPTPKFVHPLGEGDDLESRITRVTSLNRISPTPPSPRSYDQEQGHHSRSRPDNTAISKPTSAASNSRRPKRGDANVTSGSPERRWRSRSDSDPPELRAEESFDENSKGGEATKPTPTTDFVQEVVSSSRSDDTFMVTDNEPPSVDGGRLSEVSSGNNETLSPGAEALFKQLQSEAEVQDAGRSESLPSDRRFHSRRLGEPSHIFHKGNSNPLTIETRSNYYSPPINAQEPTSLRTWRSTLPFGAYDSLAERHGTSEMRRQEIIWELCETEQAFVKSLRLILRLFVQPLRHEDKTWIPGVPRDVTRLFDWFDDVMHLHSQMSSALHAARSSQYPVVIQIAETLRPFVPRLELHQPYLVRLESVGAAIEVMTKDMHSEFGEFVRIQSASPECESMNLPSFLLKPVQRLMKYPLFFKRLLEFTPRSHADHLPTFSLLHSTDMIIKVMQEVKAREEEYELVKNLASRIKGLPSGYQLARRERRLIAQGILHRVILTDGERVALEKSADAHEIQSLQSTPGMRMASTSSENSSFAGDWAYHPTRRKGEGESFGTAHDYRADSIASDVSLDSTTNVSRSTSRSTSRSRSSSLRGSLRRKPRESSVYAFVFTDLIILTTPMSERMHVLRGPKNTSDGKETWKLIDDLGVSRVLGVADQSGRLPNLEHLIAVELMSMTPNLLDFGPFSSGATAKPVYLSLPYQGISPSEGNDDALFEAKAKWFDAFERCFRFTLRSLSFPSYTGKHDSNGGTDLELDTKNSVMSILSSGLPLPMSPSQQLEETQRGRPTDLVQEEREERGWWSLRFHQVLKEVQRSSGSPVFDPASIRKNDIRSKRHGEKHSEPRPLILSPNPSITIASSRKNTLLSLGKKKSK